MMQCYASYLLLTDNTIYPLTGEYEGEDSFEGLKKFLLTESVKYARGNTCIYFIRPVGIEVAQFACKDGIEILVPQELQKRLDTEERRYTIKLCTEAREPLAVTCTKRHVK